VSTEQRRTQAWHGAAAPCSCVSATGVSGTLEQRHGAVAAQAWSGARPGSGGGSLSSSTTGSFPQFLARISFSRSQHPVGTKQQLLPRSQVQTSWGDPTQPVREITYQTTQV
jgi:hypothetical protein